MSKAATAMLVKSRAKFGRRLTQHDYDEMLSCQTVGDIAAYLRSSTHYNVSLDGIKEAAVHRGNLEQLLRTKMYQDFAELCKFERSIGEHYFEYLMTKNEIDRLLVFLRYLIAGHPEKYLFTLPDFFSKNSKIDFVSITEAKSFSDLLDKIKNTDYYPLLLPFDIESAPPDFTMIEAVLDRYRYQKACEMARRHFRGEEREELIKLFCITAELDSIRRIYRAKKYFDVSEDTLKAQLSDKSYMLNKRRRAELIGCESEADVLDILKQTKYRTFFDKNEFTFIDDFAARIKYDYCRKMMRFSPHAAVVMASTIVVFETEIENITNIIEGKRYGVDNDSIKRMLILERTVT